jgi:hypothetical protein
MDDFVKVRHPDAGEALMPRVSFEKVFKAKGWELVVQATPPVEPDEPEPVPAEEPPSPPSSRRKRSSNGGS